MFVCNLTSEFMSFLHTVLFVQQVSRVLPLIVVVIIIIITFSIGGLWTGLGWLRIGTGGGGY